MAHDLVLAFLLSITFFRDALASTELSQSAASETLSITTAWTSLRLPFLFRPNTNLSRMQQPFASHKLSQITCPHANLSITNRSSSSSLESVPENTPLPGFCHTHYCKGPDLPTLRFKDSRTLPLVVAVAPVTTDKTRRCHWDVSNVLVGNKLTAVRALLAAARLSSIHFTFLR